MVMITNNHDQTFSVLQSGVIVFTGPLAEAMQIHARLSLAAKGPARVGTKMAKREERKQAGMR